MNYIEFRKQWKKAGCFSVYELKAWDREFNTNNLTRWIKQGLLIKLRKGWYALPEFTENPDAARIAATLIYRPSYISLQKALSIYEIIPEAVINITCVTSLTTARFANTIGDYYYSSVKPEYIFGYTPIKTNGNQTYLMADAEKAILDFLYLFPFYNTEDDMINLRFDEDFMEEGLDREKLECYRQRMACKALDKRVDLLLKSYGVC